MTTTFEGLCNLLVKHHKLPLERLTLEAPLESLGIDSLGTVELLWNVEEAFHITFPERPAELSTLGDVVAYIDLLAAGQRRAAHAAAVMEGSARAA